jgi:phage terminase Nu1 subunit (DNA packaging protein)
MARTGKGQIVSRTVLAESFGRSLTTIDHWVRTGCPVVQKGGRGVRWQFNTADVAKWREDKVREEGAGTEIADEKELRRRKLLAETQKAELEYAIAKGDVAPVEQFERVMSKAFASVKVNIRNVPNRVVTRLIGETNETRFKKVLLEEIDQTLLSLSESELVNEDDLEDDELDE